MFTRVSRGGTGLQTGLSAWILAIVRALEEADVDPAPLMQGIGMDASRIGDLNYRYSQEQVTSLWIAAVGATGDRSEEHTSELQSLMRISYDVFCLNNQTAIKQ